jgi:hypothetical protein
MITCKKNFIIVICVFINFNCMAGESQLVSSERQKEFLIERDLGKAVVSWLVDSNAPAALECDKLVDSLLAVREPTARTYFIEAQVANLRQNPKKSISAIERAITKYPNDKAPIGINVPINIVGRLWISNFAKQTGDIQLAQKNYESVLSILGGTETINGVEDKGGLIMMCHLYIAELESEYMQDKQQSMLHLQAISKVKKPDGTQGAGYDLYKLWADFESTKITGGKEKANLELSTIPEVESIDVLAAQHLILNGIAGEPLTGLGRGMNIVMDKLITQVIENKNFIIDKQLACIGYGYDQNHKGNLVKAENLYSILFQGDSFFSPIAGISLSKIKMAKNNTEEANKIIDQVKKKYPGWDLTVTQIRESWKKD